MQWLRTATVHLRHSRLLFGFDSHLGRLVERVDIEFGFLRVDVIVVEDLLGTVHGDNNGDVCCKGRDFLVTDCNIISVLVTRTQSRHTCERTRNWGPGVGVQELATQESGWLAIVLVVIALNRGGGVLGRW